MTLTYEDNTSFTGRADGPGEGFAAAADEPRLAQLAGRRVTADAECFGAGHAAADTSAQEVVGDGGLPAGTFAGDLL